MSHYNPTPSSQPCVSGVSLLRSVYEAKYYAGHVELMTPWTEDNWQRRTKEILDSYARWLGDELIGRTDLEADAKALFEAPFVVVAHGTESDPVLNYGNRTALELWETDLETFLTIPSRQTAEPVHRDERANMLHRTREHGYIDDYQGIRVSTTGQRFQIDQATVWNLVDEHGNYTGQAAMFSDWRMLDVGDSPA